LVGELVDDRGENSALPRIDRLRPERLNDDGGMEVEMIAEMGVLPVS
jgi:hypothetical protein